MANSAPQSSLLFADMLQDFTEADRLAHAAHAGEAAAGKKKSRTGGMSV